MPSFRKTGLLPHPALSTIYLLVQQATDANVALGTHHLWRA